MYSILKRYFFNSYFELFKSNFEIYSINFSLLTFGIQPIS